MGEYDEEEIGELDFRSFLKIATNMTNKDTKQEIKKVFNNYDKGNKGCIIIEDLRQVAKDLGENVDDDTLVEIV